MGYDRGDSLPFNFLNQMEFQLCLKSKGKLSPRSYPIQCERKWKDSFLSAPCPELLQRLDANIIERLVPLGVMWAQLRAPMKTLEHDGSMVLRVLIVPPLC